MYDSFILQMRGRQSGNVTYPGKWIKIPNIAKQINCGKFRGAAVIDKGIIGNLLKKGPIRRSSWSIT